MIRTLLLFYITTVATHIKWRPHAYNKFGALKLQLETEVARNSMVNRLSPKKNEQNITAQGM